MNPIIVSFIPLAFVLLITPVARGIMNTVLIGINEKRWVTPFVNYDRKNTSPFVAIAFSLSLVLAVIVPLMPTMSLGILFAQEGSVMTVVGILAVITLAVSIYNPKTKLAKAFGCIALALVAGAFAANINDLNLISLTHRVSAFNLSDSITFIAALFCAVVALFDPDTEVKSNLGDSIVVQRTIWTLFITNIIWTFGGSSGDAAQKIIGLVLLGSIIKVITATLLIEGLWMLRSRLPWLTSTVFLRASVILSLVTFALAISSIAS